MESKDKDKNKSSLKKLHKNTLKKFLSSNDSSTKEDAEKKKSKKLSKKKLALLQQQQQQQQQVQAQQLQAQQLQIQQQQLKLQQQKLSKQDYDDDDDDDDDDDEDDDDDSSDDETNQSTATAQSVSTPKDLYNSIVNKMRVEYSKPVQFISYQDAMQIAHDDSSHIIFIVHCVEWFFESRNLVNNMEQVFSKDKNVLYYFINQSGSDYKKDFQGEIPGVPIISIYYRQKPFKIKRDTLDYDWNEEEKIKASLTASQLKRLLSICKQSIESYHPDENIEITIEF